MARTTGIAWSRSTWSPWIGCTEVSTEASGGGGCDHCYARELDARYRWGGAAHWGAGIPRHRTAIDYWKKPLLWNRLARMERDSGSCVDGSGRTLGANGMQHQWTMPGFWPVFPSLCDPFDDEVSDTWRDDFFDLIEETPNLTWLLLTKRAGNASKMLPKAWLQAPLHYVWMGATMVNQKEADRDLDKLRAIPAAKRFISHEPALGPVRWPTLDGISQVIVGGESTQGKHKGRMFDVAIAHSTIKQCRAAGASPFLKQFGANPQEIAYPTGVSERETLHFQRAGWTKITDAATNDTHWRKYYRLKDKAGADPSEWPPELRVQEWPA